MSRLSVDFAESFRIALRSLLAAKARGALTTLGIIIGIVAVTVTMTAANGLGNRFRESFAAVGADVIYVSRMPWVTMDDHFLFRNRPNIDLREAESLEDKLRGKAIVNPTMTTRRDMKYGSETMEGLPVIGTTERQLQMSSVQPQSGRFLLANDVLYRKSVCVIGEDVRKGLFGSANPLNQKVRIGRSTFRVIGVMEKQGGGFGDGPNFDRQVFVPISSYVKAFTGSRHSFQEVNVAVKAPDAGSLSDMEYFVIGEMRKIRKLRPVEQDNFSINKMDTLQNAYNNSVGRIFLIGLIVTSISLFVGAVGVMNIMFVSVTERTREIGVRKAIGATRNSILLQFLLESSGICLLGGVIGITIAAILTAVINASLMPASLNVPILAISVVVSITVGVIAGLIPAFRAARLDPIESLRYE
ncbi:MAG TPA: ABC transporter permease [Candidatus Eisenbacteria bacterium]|nr:ABC transporter permease [Candidatus Eisenbacteria bacterium]